MSLPFEMKKFGPKFRRIMISDDQLIIARNSGKFNDDVGAKGKIIKPGYHKFIDYLFWRQHRCRVDDFKKLRFVRHLDKSAKDEQGKPIPRLITIIEGDIGHAVIQG